MADKPGPGIDEIFAGALERIDPRERAEWLDGACGGDPALRDRVEALLDAHDGASGFLEAPAVAPDGNPPPAEGPGTRIGPYKLLQLIGEGGFGAVYMAEQEEPVRRMVALKIIKLGMDTKQVIARFEAERQALAMTEHPNIARVLDAGTTETGRPYFVMELVRGIPLNRYCDQARLGSRDRLELFAKVCRAVQHAHLKGIIHRDLKPGNVLVTLHDGVPVPKVIDFGIARATNRRLTEKTLFTEYGQFIGTPEYMSPEQAEMSGLDVDTRTDVYSLGVILYELLTGTTPLDQAAIRKAGWGRIGELIREHEPPVPSTRVSTLGAEAAEVARRRGAEPAALSRLIRGDLDWITMKALEKDRTRRYSTANELAEDVLRHLRREPVLAGPPSVGYKLRKFVARHRVGVVAGLVVAAALLAGLGLAAYGFVQSRRAAARDARVAEFLTGLLASTEPEGTLGGDTDVAALLSTARDVFGDDHATVASILGSRAIQLQNMGNLDAAEPLLRESLALWRQHGGDDHPNVALTLARLGSLLRIKGDDRGAEETLLESLAITADFRGKNRAVRVAPLFELASVLQDRGRFAEAEALLREALGIVRETTPGQRLRVGLVLNALANAIVLSGRVEAAKPVVLETLDAFRLALPPTSRLLSKVNVQVGAFLLETGDPDRAEECFREALRIHGATDDPGTGDRDQALTGLARILTVRDDRSVAYASRREEFARFLRETAGDDPIAGELLLAQAAHLEARGLTLRALPLAGDALRILAPEQKNPARSDAVALAGRLLAAVLERAAPAEAEVRAARPVAEALVAAEPGSADAANALGLARYRSGELAEAAAELARADRLRGAAGTARDLAFLALALDGLGRRDEADAVMERLRGILDVETPDLDDWGRTCLRAAEERLGRTGGGSDR